MKDRVIVEREFDAVHLDYEEITEFEYTRTRRKKPYHLVGMKKHLVWTKGQSEF